MRSNINLEQTLRISVSFVVCYPVFVFLYFIVTRNLLLSPLVFMHPTSIFCGFS